jgi:V-type H+-transporting ATPase subunit H
MRWSDVVGFASHLLALPRPFELLLSLLEGASDPVIPVLASAILTPLLATALQISPSNPSPAVQDALPKFYRYLARVIRESQERDQQDLAVQRYVSLLRTPYARETFWDMKEETMEPLARLIEETAGGSASSSSGGGNANTSGIVQGGVPLQLVYHVLLAVWELTFDDIVAAELNS